MRACNNYWIIFYISCSFLIHRIHNKQLQVEILKQVWTLNMDIYLEFGKSYLGELIKCYKYISSKGEIPFLRIFGIPKSTSNIFSIFFLHMV